jgi:DNA-binding NarL/FixJ family response regulator
MGKIRILLVDDHAVVRKGLISLLEDEENLEVVGDVGSGKEALELVPKLKPEIILLDLNMPEMSGMETAKHLKKLSPAPKILVFSMHNDADYVLKSIENGVDGYLLKDSEKDEIMLGINTVYEGNKYFPPSISAILVGAIQTKGKAIAGPKTSLKTDVLSKKEKQILKLITEGKNSKEIADLLDLSIRTVSNHRANMLKKTNLSNTAELVRIASKEGI